MSRKLVELVKRAERWPDAARQELIELAEEIDRELSAGAYAAAWTGYYELTDADRSAIDEGLAAAEQGHFATSEQVRAIFAKYRRG